MSYRKKLIEVALPLEAINTASIREKSMRHGHPSTLHLWWARRPLAAARAVIFAQMVDDPSEYVEELLTDPTTRRAAEKVYRARLKTWEECKAVYEKARAAGMIGSTNPEPAKRPILEETAAALERQRLFRILEDLVLWENTTNKSVLQPARDEVWRSWRRTCAQNANHPRAKELFDLQKLPAFHDPFSGGGSLPLEAQRLGLESFASDLNPVAVLINKAMIEIPPKFADRPPVNPDARRVEDYWSCEWKSAQGLAEDVRYYGQWMRVEAEKRIGYLYPKMEVTTQIAKDRPDLKPYIGQKLTVIAWIWTRTVKSPNPAFAQVDVPLSSTFMLSTKVGKEAYVEPVIEGGNYRFTIRVGKPKDQESVNNGTKSGGSHSTFLCLMSGTPMPFEYLRAEAKAGRMGVRLMATIAEGERGRVYLPPTDAMEVIARKAQPEWKPETPLYGKCRVNVSLYGFDTYGDLFTPRQLVTLTTFSDLVQEVREQVNLDAHTAGLSDDRIPLAIGGEGATAYADAIAVYLAFLVNQVANHSSSLCSWNSPNAQMRAVFARQAIPMVWDYAESNPLCDLSGSYSNLYERQIKGFEALGDGSPGFADQADAINQTMSIDKLISTDPPYYDNIAYADLSDFFYVWLRRSLKPVFPNLFATMAVPKAEELVADTLPPRE